MKLQISNPADHPCITTLPFATPLDEWDLPHQRRVLGLHRHVVKIVELDNGGRGQRTSYVVKELPDKLAEREYRLLRWLVEQSLPTVEVVAVVTERSESREGLIITRHLDYSLPYRSMLSGHGLTIPYIGDRVLDALVGLLVRLHLAGFYWGDCSLSNTLFRRDAGALEAYVIDTETSEVHATLTKGQRETDLQIALENLAGGLLDLQAGGKLVPGIDPWKVAGGLADRYRTLWTEVTGTEEFDSNDMWRVEQRIQRLHDLGFDVDEVEVQTADDTARRLRLSPKVVESGYHEDRLFALTALHAGQNQARRMLDDIHRFAVEMRSRTGKQLPENIAAVRWLDQRFEPIVAAIPPELVGKLQAAEIFHQILEHRWYLSERAGRDVPMPEVVRSYVDTVLRGAPDEKTRIDPPTAGFVLPVDG